MPETIDPVVECFYVAFEDVAFGHSKPSEDSTEKIHVVALSSLHGP